MFAVRTKQFGADRTEYSAGLVLLTFSVIFRSTWLDKGWKNKMTSSVASSFLLSLSPWRRQQRQSFVFSDFHLMEKACLEIWHTTLIYSFAPGCLSSWCKSSNLHSAFCLKIKTQSTSTNTFHMILKKQETVTIQYCFSV